MSVKEKIRSILRTLIPRELRAGLYATKHRIWWKIKGGKWAMQHSGRADIVKAVALLCKTLCLAHVKIIKFGCSAGWNSAHLRSLLDIPVSYHGVDISEDAIAIAKQRFPESEWFVCDDLVFAELAKRLGHFDVFLAVGVFYYIPPDKAIALLKVASGLADYIVVCDDMSQFDEPAAEIDGLFLHAYAALCREAGLRVVGRPISLNSSDRHGYFVASAAASA